MDVVVTLDVDWAPDYMLEFTYEIFERFEKKATWMMTHRSEYVETLRKKTWVEVGIHPNFLPRSSHGNSPEEVIETITSWFPEAVCSRSHAVVQSGPILNLLSSRIKADSSTFLPGYTHIKPIWQRTGVGKICRLPFCWADDDCLLLEGYNWKADSFSPPAGLCVIMFHPVHVYLNSDSPLPYQNLKTAFPNGFSHISELEAQKFCNPGTGTRTFLEELLSQPDYNFIFMNEAIPK